MMNTDEAPLELLAPSASMSALLAALSGVLDRPAGDDAAVSVSPAAAPVFWDDLPVQAFVHEAARLPLLEEGWSAGEISDTDLSAGEILHELSSTLGIMSSEDLDERFRLLVEGAGAAADFRRVQSAERLKDLLKNDAVLGWSGFDVMTHDKTVAGRMERLRMTADFLRGRLDWTALRGWDLLQGAAFVVKAEASDTAPPEDVARMESRIAGELLLRCSSWEDLRRAWVLGEFWKGLATSERAAAEALQQAAKTADLLLSTKNPKGAWAAFAWPVVKADEDAPEVY